MSRQETYVCDHCGKSFVGHARNGRWHFCDRACLTGARRSGGVIAISRHRELERQCLQCGRTFTYTLHNKKKLYCDRKCAGLSRRSGGLIALKVDATTFAHHGVRKFFCDTERMKIAMQINHGVDNASNIPGLRKESWKKAHETKKRNGTYKASKIEIAFCDAVETEGIRIERQFVVLGKPIDLYLYDENVYVQIDGRYWHGLDRSIEEIETSQYVRDRSIYERWQSDRRQDEQFAERGLKLVRVTDLEAREWLKQRKKLLPLIQQKLQMKWTP